ncbi:MAG: hypothetical protein R3F34_07890 [Planctomycetota bacterium]
MNSVRRRASILALALLSLALVAPPDAAAQRERRPAATEIDLADLDAHVGFVSDGAVFVDQRSPKRSLTKDEREVDRVALLDGAIARAKAEGRLVLWYVPRIVENELRGAQMYRAPILDLYCRQVFFCDADVDSILATRFVPVRCTVDEALAAKYELRPLDVIEPMFLVLDGDGNVLERIDRVRSFDPLWFAEWLRSAANAHQPASGSDDPVVLAERGEWERALELTTADDDAGHLARARLLYLLRRPDEALAELDAIGRQRGEANTLRGRILVAQGRYADAKAPLMAAASARDPEAGYLLAHVLLASGDEAGAQRRFAFVAQNFPETLAGKRALANVHLGRDELPAGAAFCGYENLEYLPAAAYAPGAHDTSWRGEPVDSDTMRRRGVHFLLRMQRDNGGFTDARYAYWPDSSITPNTWMAVTALASCALLEHRDVDPDAVDAALLRAEAYMFDPARLNRGSNEDVYADAYRLEYLVRRAEQDPDTAKLQERRMRDIVAAAQSRQESSGFFAHEYPNAFCTGAMLEALLMARRAGVPVPEGVLGRGADALESARTTEGAFVYGGAAQGGGGSVKDAAGRMPLCEAVLLQLGRGDRARLDFALDNYWATMPRMEKVRRNDFHSDGELAGFFFFHDLYHTSQAIRLLPDEVRAGHAKKLLEVLRAVPEFDGSFVDSHEFGKSYGTAMALLVLANVR